MRNASSNQSFSQGTRNTQGAPTGGQGKVREFGFISSIAILFASVSSAVRRSISLRAVLALAISCCSPCLLLGAESHKSASPLRAVLTTTAQVHALGGNFPRGMLLHLTGTITYYDTASGTMFLEDGVGGVYFNTSKPYPVHVGDSVSLTGFPSAGYHTEVASDPEIQVLKQGDEPAPYQTSWFSLEHFIEGLAGLGVLALGAGIWAAFLRSRVVNQTAWIDRTVTIAGERSRILEKISSNDSLKGVLGEICCSTMGLLPGTHCSYSLKIEDELLESETEEERATRGGATLFEVTLRDSEQEPLGRMVVSAIDVQSVSTDTEEVYRVLSELAALALRQSLLYRGLVYHSTHDPLTELPNRRLCESRMQDALTEAEAKGGQMAVIYIDINRFKQVNDEHGHKIGDLYLQQISARLQHQLRPVDMLARVGGDEFVVVAPFPEGFDRAFVLTSRLQRCFKDQFELDGITIHGSASFGFARYPEHGRTAEELTRHADHAMYVAKHEDRISEEAHGLAIITASELELAFFNGRYRLAYQPQFSAAGRLTGMETLIRLDHPTLGLLTPEAFISVAEKNPIIIDIGAWALRCAVQDAMRWNLDTGEEVSLAVNVSSRQLEEPGYAKSVLACLKQNRFPPERLELELIERNLMFSGEKVMDQLVQLRAAGVRISLDDFGTEQSCLSMLHKLPIDTIKLDRSFIRAMDSEANVIPIIQAIVSMAHSLGKRVVAEAIEHVGPVPALLKMGKMDFQGYLLSRPVPADLVPALLDEWRSGIAMPAAFAGPDQDASRQLTLCEMPRTRTA